MNPVGCDDYKPQPNWYTNFKVKTIHTQMQHIGLICKSHFPATLTPTDTKTGTQERVPIFYFKLQPLITLIKLQKIGVLYKLI